MWYQALQVKAAFADEIRRRKLQDNYGDGYAEGRISGNREEEGENGMTTAVSMTNTPRIMPTASVVSRHSNSGDTVNANVMHAARAGASADVTVYTACMVDQQIRETTAAITREEIRDTMRLSMESISSITRDSNCDNTMPTSETPDHDHCDNGTRVCDNALSISEGTIPNHKLATGTAIRSATGDTGRVARPPATRASSAPAEHQQRDSSASVEHTSTIERKLEQSCLKY